MNMRTLRITLWLSVAALGAFFTVGHLWQSNQVSNPPKGLEEPLLSASFQLLDQNENPIDEKSMQGKSIAVFFGFTHCPEICPTTLQNLDHYIRTLHREGHKLSGYFITVDPQRDTPQVLKAYLAGFQDRITGITGSVDEVNRLLKHWKVYSKIIPLEDSDYTIDHTASIFLIDRQGRLQGILGYQDTSNDALQKLRNFLSQ